MKVVLEGIGKKELGDGAFVTERCPSVCLELFGKGSNTDEALSTFGSVGVVKRVLESEVGAALERGAILPDGVLVLKTLNRGRCQISDHEPVVLSRFRFVANALR